MSEETASTAEGTTAPESAPPATQEATQEAGAGKAGASEAGDHKSSAAPAASTKRDDKGKFAPVSAEWKAGFDKWIAGEQGWRDVTTDPDLKAFTERINSPTDLLKSTYELRKEVSTRIKLPGKDAKPEDIAKFNKAVGAGEKPEDYKFATAEGEELTPLQQKTQARVAAILHKNGAKLTTPLELQQVLKEAAEEDNAERDRVALKQRGDSEALLAKEWGADDKANRKIAEKAVADLGGPEAQALLNEPFKGGKLGDYPAMLRMMAAAGRLTEEGRWVGVVGADEIKSAEQGMDAKTAAMIEANKAGNKELAARLQAELFEERRRVHGSAPIGRR